MTPWEELKTWLEKQTTNQYDNYHNGINVTIFHIKAKMDKLEQEIIQTRLCSDCFYWHFATSTEFWRMNGGCIGWCGRADLGFMENLPMGPKDSCTRWVSRQSKKTLTNSGFGLDPL